MEKLMSNEIFELISKRLDKIEQALADLTSRVQKLEKRPA